MRITPALIGSVAAGGGGRIFTNPNAVLDFNGIGADGSTSFFDLSPFGSTVLFGGDAAVETSSPVAASYSSIMQFTANGYVSLAASATRFALGSQEHTFEGYFWFGNTGGFQTMLACIDSAGSAFDFNIGAFTGGFAAPNYQLYTSSGLRTVSATLNVPLTTLTHIAFCRQAGSPNDTMRVYVNGVQNATASIVSGLAVNNNTTATVDCGQVRYLSQRRMSGRAQGVRLVIGQCLYPNGTTFTPPTLPYTY